MYFLFAIIKFGKNGFYKQFLGHGKIKTMFITLHNFIRIYVF